MRIKHVPAVRCRAKAAIQLWAVTDEMTPVEILGKDEEVFVTGVFFPSVPLEVVSAEGILGEEPLCHWRQMFVVDHHGTQLLAGPNQLRKAETPSPG